MLYRDYSSEKIETAVEFALENSLSNSDGIRHMIMYSRPEEEFAPLANWPATLIPDVTDYAKLGVVR
jgi:hypothetical protein